MALGGSQFSSRLKPFIAECLDQEICLVCGRSCRPSWRKRIALASLDFPGEADWPSHRAEEYPVPDTRSRDRLLANLESNLCRSCIAAWPHLNRRALQQLKNAEIWVAFPYQAAVKSALLAYKFSGLERWGQVLAALLYLNLGSLIPKNALICPMPGTRRRNRERGFNPPGLIVDHLAVAGHYQVVSDLILRSGEGPYQHELPSRQARLENARKGLNLDLSKLAQYRGRKIYFIDDIVTTGASLMAVGAKFGQAGLDVQLIAVAGGGDFYLSGCR